MSDTPKSPVSESVQALSSSVGEESEIHALKQWVASQLPLLNAGKAFELKDFLWEPLSSDAGFRRYFRLRDVSGHTFMAVFAPPSSENTRTFVEMARFFSQHGVPVPKVHSCDMARGFLVVEDLGDRLLSSQLNQESVNGHYAQVLAELMHLQTITPDTRLFAPYDQSILRDEMQRFVDWFVRHLLGYTLDERELDVIQVVFTLLEKSALAQPQTIVHRDFHSRNILLSEAGTPTFIDFQDALTGPITYDLVSLLKDCYQRWPQNQVKEWALGYGNMLMSADLLHDVSEQQFLTWFDWMGLQRHLKVLGVFSRLHLRDAKSHYLNDLPLVIQYVRETMAGYDEFEMFLEWFDGSLMPLVQKQSWMNDE